MSIRYKILAGCFSLTLLTVALGMITSKSQTDLGLVATRIYDQALMSLSYLRAGQNELAIMRAEILQRENTAISARSPAPDHRQLIGAARPAIQEDLQVAQDRAMSDEGRAAVARLAEQVGALDARRGTATLLSELAQLQEDLDTAVEIYAGDGYRYRRSVGQVVERTHQTTWLAVAASVIVALLITYLLGRSIVPAMQKAVGVAQAIAAGKLDNHIVVKGRGEAPQLLAALARMQDSIAANLQRITTLMADQAERHADQIGTQNARFEAALNNMSQGLCMFDAEQRLRVYNRAFVRMFGEPSMGSTAASVLLKHTGGQWLDQSQKLTMHELPDGRIISVSNEPMSEGGWVATYEDVTERRRVEERLSFMARHDALTGLPNRLMFREEMERAGTSARSVAVLCLDLDGFKNVNDTLGHPVGDQLLCAVAKRLKTAARANDLVVRLGGDEFALLCPDPAGPGAVAALAAEIVRVMSQPFMVDVHQVVVGASVGIALIDIAEFDPDDLLKKADLALYRAKEDGRNNFKFFEPEMDARIQARRALESDLRDALQRNEFLVVFQPLVRTDTGETAGFEALVRWRHPARGLVPPATFIPVAEEIGLIEEIGNWVLRAACSEAMNWPDYIKIAVNLSPIQFRNRALALQVASILSDTGLPASRLELEITESVLLNDSDMVLSILKELKLLGVSISMDDFGTGYSSLSYLHKFPFDKIKIDQCFIRGLFDSDGLAIVRAVIALGGSLGIDVIAEGVETAEQLQTLRDEGCPQAQGYLFSRPRPAAELAPFMSQEGRGAAA